MMYAFTASSVCMGRSPNCGRRIRIPRSVRRRKAAQRVNREGGKAGCVSGDLFRSSRTTWDRSELIGSIHQRGRWAVSDGGFAPHFDLNVVVQFVGCVPVAVKTNIAPLRVLGID